MEHKIYKRYTKPKEEYRIKIDAKTIGKVIEVSGKVKSSEVIQFSSGNNLRIKIDKNYYYFSHDDITRFIKNDLEKNANITIRYITDREMEKHIVVCEMHDKDYTIINQYYQTVLTYKEEKEKVYQKSYNILCPYMGEKLLWFVLSRNDKEGYKYKLEKIEKTSDYEKSYNDLPALYTLCEKYFGDKAEDMFCNYFSCDMQGCCIDIPESDKVYICSHTTSRKNRDCAFCGSLPYDNFSLRMGGYVSDYYCAYCFFEENGIEVPEEFFKDL